MCCKSMFFCMLTVEELKVDPFLVMIILEGKLADKKKFV